MKVWVPIDAPDNFTVDYVVGRGGKDGVTLVQLGPVGPVRRFDEEPPKPIGSAIRGGPYSPEAQRERSEPQRERWEYNSVAIDALDPDRATEEFGAEGWELLPLVVDGIIWFKRRLIP